MSLNDIRETVHRFSDVAGEPLIMLAPIEGFNKKPLVTLEEASVPLINIVPRLSTYVHVAKERAINPANDLSVDESASIALYTMEWEPYTESLYFILNNTLRTEERQNLKPWFLYLKLIFTALSRLPSISLTVYRGVRSETGGEYEQYQVGEKLVWWGFSSCSKHRNISEKDQFLGESGRKTLFKIDCIKGKDISKHSYYRKEEEVLLLPATKMEVITNEHRKNNLNIIRLKEVESSFILLEPVSTEEEITALKKQPNLNQSLPPLVSRTPSILPDRSFNPALLPYIVRWKPRSEVYLIGQRFNMNDMEVIAEQIIIDRQCRQLFLRESGVTSQGAIVISKALHNNNTLERLFISHNKIGDEGAEALAKSLSDSNNATLKELCLGNNGITDNGIEHIADMLQSNKTLTHLWLASNNISDRGLKRLVDVLSKTNKTLQILSLEWNKFHSDSSVSILIDMLNNNQSLTSLNLNSCELSKPAIKQLKTVANKKKNFKLIIH